MLFVAHRCAQELLKMRIGVSLALALSSTSVWLDYPISPIAPEMLGLAPLWAGSKP